MNKQQAQNIIKDTFENPFDKGRFTCFIKNLLNHIENATFTYQGKIIPEKFRPFIKTLERIGKFSDGENSLDILVITLQKRDLSGTCPHHATQFYRLVFERQPRRPNEGRGSGGLRISGAGGLALLSDQDGLQVRPACAASGCVAAGRKDQDRKSEGQGRIYPGPALVVSGGIQ